jgi:SAM-dependent methyltransferase
VTVSSPPDSSRCPVCSSRNLATLYPDTLGEKLPAFGYSFTPLHGMTYEILRCRDCTHAFSACPRTDIWEGYEDVVDPSYLERQDERQLTFPQVVDELARHSPRGRLLDVGCATGDFVEIAGKRYRAEGLEPSQWAADIARGRGLVVHSRQLGDLPGDPAYDLITLWGVIEHFESPRVEVGHIRRLLNPGGLVAVWTGDRCSWLARLMGRKWWYIQGQHLHLFSRRSLDLLFAQAGFGQVSHTLYPFTTTFHHLSRSLDKYRVMGPLGRIVLDNRFLAGTRIRLRLPTEMFAIFRKE